MQDQTFDILSMNEARLDNTIHSDEVRSLLMTLYEKTETEMGAGSHYTLEGLFHT